MLLIRYPAPPLRRNDASRKQILSNSSGPSASTAWISEREMAFGNTAVRWLKSIQYFP